MNRNGNQRPRQSPGKDQTKMTLRPHKPHYGHPANALVKEIAERREVSNALHDVREQLNFIPKLGDQATNAEVIGWTIFDGLVAAEGGDILPPGNNGLSEREFHTVQLPGHKNSGEEVGNHPYR